MGQEHHETNRALHERLRAGDATARDELITANLGLVVDEVKHYLNFYPFKRHLRDELIGAGNEGLVQAVDKLATTALRERIAAYLRRAVRHALIEQANALSDLPIPRTTRRRKKQRGEPLDERRLYFVGFTRDRGKKDGYEVRGYDHMDTFRVEGTEFAVDLLDTLQSLCTADELELLRLRAERRTFKEIGEILKISEDSAARRWHAIKDRCLKAWTEP